MAEYIWLDGTKSGQELRSKTRIIEITDFENLGLQNFPEWSFDGSSTYQSDGNHSDLYLEPVCFVDDPIRGEGNFLVLCEVLNDDKTPHKTNKRAVLKEILKNGGNVHKPWIGFEQEYTLFKGSTPLGWPENGYPLPQGPFYCGVGAEKVFGRTIAEEHMEACIDAEILIYGINAEVMPAQWEFQIGYRGFEDEEVDALELSDHLWLSRWLLCRIAEEHEVTVSFDNKPVKGDWNGAGCHTNFSTTDMRNKEKGIQTINQAIESLSKKHSQHIAVYGHGLAERLTGLHETCSVDQFRSGVADRGASIRIPSSVQQKGCGYFEDRRPGANCDPYVVVSRLITTICDVDEKLLNKEDSIRELQPS